MKSYYIRTATYGTETPHIVDEEQIYQAERGMNYLNPDEFNYLCEAGCMKDAEEQYWEEFSKSVLDYLSEKNHP